VNKNHGRSWLELRRVTNEKEWIKRKKLVKTRGAISMGRAPTYKKGKNLVGKSGKSWPANRQRKKRVNQRGKQIPNFLAKV